MDLHVMVLHMCIVNLSNESRSKNMYLLYFHGLQHYNKNKF